MEKNDALMLISTGLDFDYFAPLGSTANYDFRPISKGVITLSYSYSSEGQNPYIKYFHYVPYSGHAFASSGPFSLVGGSLHGIFFRLILV